MSDTPRSTSPAAQIERRTLVTGPLPQNIAQPQKDEDGQSQKNDGVNIHVGSLSDRCCTQPEWIPRLKKDHTVDFAAHM